MIKLIIVVILVILFIWGIIGYRKWLKENKENLELEKSRNRNKALRKKSEAVKTNIQNAGIAKALGEIENDLNDDFIELSKIMEEVEQTVTRNEPVFDEPVKGNGGSFGGGGSSGDWTSNDNGSSDYNSSEN